MTCNNNLFVNKQMETSLGRSEALISKKTFSIGMSNQVSPGKQHRIPAQALCMF